MVDLSLLANEPLPAAALIGGGVLSILVSLYGRRDDSHLDELGTFVAFLLGILTGVIAFSAGVEGTVGWFSLVVMVVLAATLFLKPLKSLPWAGMAGIAAGAVAVYFASGYITGSVLGLERWIWLVIIFFIVGGIVHMLFHFIEDILTIARMVLDWRPVMVIVGLVAVIEGALLLMDTSLVSLL